MRRTFASDDGRSRGREDGKHRARSRLHRHGRREEGCQDQSKEAERRRQGLRGSSAGGLRWVGGFVLRISRRGPHGIPGLNGGHGPLGGFVLRISTLYWLFLFRRRGRGDGRGASDGDRETFGRSEGRVRRPRRRDRRGLRAGADRRLAPVRIRPAGHHRPRAAGTARLLSALAQGLQDAEQRPVERELIASEPLPRIAVVEGQPFPGRLLPLQVDGQQFLQPDLLVVDEFQHGGLAGLGVRRHPRHRAPRPSRCSRNRLPLVFQEARSHVGERVRSLGVHRPARQVDRHHLPVVGRVQRLLSRAGGRRGAGRSAATSGPPPGPSAARPSNPAARHSPGPSPPAG